jgi:type IV secretion system protein VirB6
MAGMCPTNPGSGIVTRLVDSVDCHIATMVHDSYRNLVGPDTWFSAAFTVLLTIYIALMGYQLILGRNGLRLTDLPVSVLKIGLILAFLTSWAAYQTVVFDLLFDGPRQILATILGPMTQGTGLPSDFYLGIEQSYATLATAATTYGSMASPSANILQGGPMLGAGILWLSSLIMLLSTVGLIIAAKIVLGFLLAVGPIFIGLFLFDTTRGFFDGWIRTTVAFAFAPLTATIFGTAMLIMLQPFLISLNEQVVQGTFDMGSVMTIGVITIIFLIVMMQVLRLGASLTGGFSTARGSGRRTSSDADREGSRGGMGVEGRVNDMPLDTDRRSAEIASRAASGERAAFDANVMANGGDRRAGAIADGVASSVPPSERLGQSARRMPRPTRRAGEGT